MKVFISDYINTTLFIHLIFSLVLIFLLKLIINSSIKFKSNKIDKTELTSDEYFVMNNNYDPEKIFYFITYKLYHNGILKLKVNEGKFYYLYNESYLLNQIETEISNLYTYGLSPKNYNNEMINQKLFKDYFDSTYEKLILNNFIKSKQKILFDKFLFIIGLVVICVPGIFLLFYLQGLFFSKIIMNLLITIFMYVFFLKESILSKLTAEGIKANNEFQEKNPYYSYKLKNNNFSNDMDKFLLQNIDMYYADNDMNDFDNNEDDFDDD